MANPILWLRPDPNGGNPLLATCGSGGPGTNPVLVLGTDPPPCVCGGVEMIVPGSVCVCESAGALPYPVALPLSEVTGIVVAKINNVCYRFREIDAIPDTGSFTIPDNWIVYATCPDCCEDPDPCCVEGYCGWAPDPSQPSSVTVTAWISDIVVDVLCGLPGVPPSNPVCSQEFSGQTIADTDTGQATTFVFSNDEGAAGNCTAGTPSVNGIIPSSSSVISGCGGNGSPWPATDYNMVLDETGFSVVSDLGGVSPCTIRVGFGGLGLYLDGIGAGCRVITDLPSGVTARAPVGFDTTVSVPLTRTVFFSTSLCCGAPENQTLSYSLTSSAVFNASFAFNNWAGCDAAKAISVGVRPIRIAGTVEMVNEARADASINRDQGIRNDTSF